MAPPPSREMILQTWQTAHKMKRRLVAVRGARAIGKKDMIHNDWLPHIEVDPQTYEVRANGQLLTCAPLAELPLAQRYFLF